jgi:hypothetical protein
MRVASGVKPLLAMAMVLGTACGHVLAFDLVSAQEMHASLAAGEPLTAKSKPVAGSPEIEVVHPKLDAPVASPTPIQLMFVPAAASKVRPETFKVLYGRLRIDITQRLVNEARITAEGVTVKEASLPKGTHRLVLSVQDVQGREGSKSLDFEIK